MLLWLGSINILLAVFNMIPGFPLDGGRVLRSILWAITGNLRRATQMASQVGQIVAWLFIVAGIMMVFGYDFPLLGTGLINGLWIAFIGWFLNSAALQSYRQVVIHDMLHGVPVARLMRSNPPTVSSNVSISSLVHDYVMGTDDHAFPVIDDGQLVGIVTLEDIRSVGRDTWDSRHVQEIMTPTSNWQWLIRTKMRLTPWMNLPSWTCTSCPSCVTANSSGCCANVIFSSGCICKPGRKRSKPCSHDFASTISTLPMSQKTAPVK